MSQAQVAGAVAGRADSAAVTTAHLLAVQIEEAERLLGLARSGAWDGLPAAAAAMETGLRRLFTPPGAAASVADRTRLEAAGLGRLLELTRAFEALAKTRREACGNDLRALRSSRHATSAYGEVHRLSD